ncbi:SRPBCC family protein [Modestobacter roseus]|uniref:Polyketide cyclase/dehydrase/lipid transport protein n=1 Tax=Modestobacter roseus TaxID=1181884 RepID=A0A562IXG3_9ACTN|nr:SRPBCC family protein [Modestobacter roseus]MQA32759.1 SRPBCC family protein [Modestobacter roseus]TWH75751.1 polyketide cyclase/dehydrase/lipid transport protein [Modestobacter roseus]
MGQVVATTERIVHAPAEQVRAALVDYTVTRPRILPEQYSEYRVDAGGQGAGTRVHWRLQATSKRVRVQDVTVSEAPDGSLVETDANSSMITTWRVHRADEGVSTVRVSSAWTGAGGIGGFFERTFAPKGLGRIHAALLDRLEQAVTTG